MKDLASPSLDLRHIILRHRNHAADSLLERIPLKPWHPVRMLDELNNLYKRDQHNDPYQSLLTQIHSG